MADEARMGLGMVLPMGRPPAEVLAAARFAEEVGLQSVWAYEDLYFPGSLTTLGAVVASTSHIRVGVGTVSPYTRSPVVLAMEAGQLHQLSAGRFILGLGASPATLVSRMGIDASKPLTTMREAIAIIRQLFAGGVDRFDGARFQVNDVHLHFEVEGRGAPIYVGAIGDKMLALTGAAADGLILSILCPLPFIRRATQHVGEAARSAGRDPEAIDVVAYVPFALDDDADAARASLKPDLARRLARSAGKPDLERLFTAHGVLTSEQLSDIARRWGEEEDPRDIVSDDVVDALCLAGNELDIARKVHAYRAAGVRELSVYGLGTDQQSREMLQVLASMLVTSPAATDSLVAAA